MINTIITIVQIASAFLMVTGILLQSRGVGLGAAFGGDGNVYRTKRGVEKKLFQTTIIFSIIFFGASLANVLT